jgi:peptidoglycan/xylan/chitin deacetylase (PgdA/CDA1 family)
LDYLGTNRHARPRTHVVAPADDKLAYTVMQNVYGTPALLRVRHAVKRTLLSSGYYARRLSRLEFPGAAVLCYHSIRRDDDTALPFSELHVSERTFEQHCQLIAEHCHPISLRDLREARRGTRPLPARAVLVTFDDGYRAVLDVALPILERYKVPATVFGCSGPIMHGTHFWFDSLYRSAGESAVLNARSAPAAAWMQVVTANQTPAPSTDRHRPLTVEELRQLAASPLIEIGAHTLSHPTLALMSVEEQQREVEGSRSVLQQLVRSPIEAFAYPYGASTQDYSAESVSAVRGAGFDLAFTTARGFATVDCPPYEIPRFVMLDAIDAVELAHRLSYSWHV